MSHRINLGVNVDHVATIRQARGVDYPDPVEAAVLAEKAGADSITIHLREDRRHIQDHDLKRMAKAISTHINLELAVTPEMLNIAIAAQPSDVCLVPEKREELTTEGGLNLTGNTSDLSVAIERLKSANSRVALFVDPDTEAIRACAQIGADVVELHTGTYADADSVQQARELNRIQQAAALADSLGLTVHAGHGLTLENVGSIARIPPVRELNIGHAIIARSIMVGIQQAVVEMRDAIAAAGKS